MTDYLNFDYKKACKECSMKELEILLFKSRVLSTFAFTNRQLKDCDDLLEILVMGTICAGYIIFFFFYSAFDGIKYFLTHKEKDKSIARYNEIRWRKTTVYGDDGYTTFDDIQRLADIIDEVKENIVAERLAEQQAKQSKYSPEEISATDVLKKALAKDNVLYGIVTDAKIQIQHNKHDKCQFVSFGEEINNALTVLLKEKINFCTINEKSYLLIFDDDLTPLTDGIKEFTGLSDVKISLMRDIIREK